MSSAVQGWLTSCIGEVIEDIADGGTPHTNRTNYFNGNIPWVVIQDIRPRIETTRMNLTELGLASCSARLWPVGAIILSTGATIGEVGIATIPLATKQGIVGIVCKKRVLNRFLYYKLLSLKSYLRANAQGSTIKEVRPDFIRSIFIKYPSDINEQNGIARILEQLDKAIEQTEAIIAKQQRIKTGLMQDLLTKGIDENGNIRSEATHKFKDSPLGRIPEEWVVEPCEILCREIIVGIVIRPAQYYKTDGIPVLRSANVRENKITGENLVFMSKKDNESLAKSKLATGDLVTVRTGYPGTTGVIPPEFDGCNCVDIVISRPKPEKIRSSFLSMWINSFHGKRQVIEGQGGLAQQHFNVSEMRSLLVNVPDIYEQERIESLLSLHKSTISNSERELGKLSALKIGLMHDLLTGKVRVTDTKNPTLTPESL